MMKISKEVHDDLDSICAMLQEKYPNAKVTKPLLGGKILTVPFDNFNFILRDKKKYLAVDFTLPPKWHTFAAIMIGAIGLAITKAVFKSRRKQRFQDFINDVDLTINKIGSIDSIGQQLM